MFHPHHVEMLSQESVMVAKSLIAALIIGFFLAVVMNTKASQ